MTDWTVSGAVEEHRKDALTQLAVYQKDFAAVLPSHINSASWVRIAQGALRSGSPKMREAANRDVGAFLAACLDCARLGLEPGSTYHFVPFAGSIVGIEDYKGIIELMYRAGAVSSVKAEIVYVHDEYSFNPDAMARPSHIPAGGWFADQATRGAMVGAYAYAEMTDGSTSRVVMMARWEIEEHKAMSRTGQDRDGMWLKWPRSAWLKTVTRELSKWVPTSPEWLTNKISAQRAGRTAPVALSDAAMRLPPVTRDYPDILDGDVVDDDPPASDERVNSETAATSRIFALLKEGGIDGRQRAVRLRIVSRILQRSPADPVNSYTDLTREEVTTIRDFLQHHKDAGILAHTLNDLGSEVVVADPDDPPSP